MKIIYNIKNIINLTDHYHVKLQKIQLFDKIVFSYWNYQLYIVDRLQEVKKMFSINLIHYISYYK